MPSDSNSLPHKGENVELAETFFNGVLELQKESNRHTESVVAIVKNSNVGANGKEVIYETTESHEHQHSHEGTNPLWLLLLIPAFGIGVLFGGLMAPKPKPQAPLGDAFHSLNRLVGDEQKLCRNSGGVVIAKSIATVDAVTMTANDCKNAQNPEALKKELAELQSQFPYSLPAK